MAAVARAVHVSPSHLRRLFRQVRGENPLKTFTQMRLQRVMELLSETPEKLEVVAARCGFSSAADLCRVFRRVHHASPHQWRKARLRPYREPRPRPRA